MSRARNIYRRYARKPVTSNAPAQSKQQPPAFFEFGGERSFFTGKGTEAAVNPKCEPCDMEHKTHKKDNEALDNVAVVINDEQRDKVDNSGKEQPAHVAKENSSTEHEQSGEIKEQVAMVPAATVVADKGNNAPPVKEEAIIGHEPEVADVKRRETDNADRQ